MIHFTHSSVINNLLSLLVSLCVGRGDIVLVGFFSLSDPFIDALNYPFYKKKFPGHSTLTFLISSKISSIPKFPFTLI